MKLIWYDQSNIMLKKFSKLLSKLFCRPIKRKKIKNFATQAGRFKVTSASVKNLVTVTMTRDLFGSILFHGFQAKVDMGEVLQYPPIIIRVLAHLLKILTGTRERITDMLLIN